MKNYRGENPNLLVLDAGNVIQHAGEIGDILADFYSVAYPERGYDAVGLGDGELRYMSESGRRSVYGKNVPLVSINATDRGTGERIAQPYLIKVMPSGLKVCITSVLEDGRIGTYNPNTAGVQVTNAQDALAKQVQEIRDKVHIVIVLARMERPEARKLATAGPGVDLILISNYEYPPYEGTAEYRDKVYFRGMGAEKIGDTIVMPARQSGLSIGKLVLDLDASGKIASFEHDYIPVNDQAGDDKALAWVAQRYQDDVADYLTRYPKNYFPAIRPQDVRPSTVMTRHPETYATATTCGLCHPREYESWKLTDHYVAFTNLKPTRQHREPECVGCHVTGFGQPGGFRSEKATPELAGVQCEACHGPGAAHARNPRRGYGKIDPFTCLGCHDKKNSPGFDFQEYNWRAGHVRQ